MKQKYLFPLNYHYAGKLLGIIDYQLLIPLSLYAGGLIMILHHSTISLMAKIIIFIFAFLPLTLLLNSRVNHEPFYLFIFAILKHFFRAKIYLFQRKITSQKDFSLANR